jgi:hypothetical protein
MLKFEKYRVCRFAPSPLHVLDKFPHGNRFFSLYGKNLSPCGKFNDIDAKHNQKSVIFTMRELAKDKLFTLCWKIYRMVRNFYCTGRIIFRCAGTCPGHVTGLN